MWKFQKGDIDIVDIDHAFITDYEFWLRSVRNCANNTAVKYLKNFNKIIKFCLVNDWLEKTYNFRITYKDGLVFMLERK